MTREELIEWASPPCWDCGEPIVVTEMPYVHDDDGAWRVMAIMICRQGHRMLVPPI